MENIEKILAIELMYAAQALEFRRPHRFSKIIEDNYAIIEKVDKLEDDRLLKDDIVNMVNLVINQSFIVN